MSIANTVYIPVLSGIFAEGELLLYILLSDFLFSSTQSDCVYKWRFLSRIGGVDNGPCKNYNQKSNKNEQEVYIYYIQCIQRQTPKYNYLFTPFDFRNPASYAIIAQ